MQGVLYEEHSVFLFLLVTVVMGGWTAWMTGKAMAKTWRPLIVAVLYFLLLGAVVRFIHYALFQGTLLSLQYYVVDTAIVMAIGIAGFRYTRSKQMTSQYKWLFKPQGPFAWTAVDKG